MTGIIVAPVIFFNMRNDYLVEYRQKREEQRAYRQDQNDRLTK